MEMVNIGKSEDWSVPQHILVEGAPGIGKTMFAWELCRQWAEGQLLQDWEIVQMLQLRNKGMREAKSLSDLFYHANSGIKQEVLEHITSSDGKGVFLIFEGYDELAEDQKTEGSIFHSLLVGEILPKATIMVTSRPLASQSLCQQFRESENLQHIEIVGFTDDDIELYVETTCKKQPGILLADLKSFVSSNPFVSSVMYIPLQCAILTAVYIQNWKKKGKSYAPRTLTQLYTDLVLSLLSCYIYDHPDYKKQKLAIRELSDFPRDVQEQVWKLSQLAAEGLENRQYVFDGVPCDTMGLMQRAEEELMLATSVSYCFLHLTLQEYLATLYWSKLGSAEVVRVVNESGLFPLKTLVCEGVEKKIWFSLASSFLSRWSH